MKDSYHRIAPIYSKLSRLVFGQSLNEANQWAMGQIKEQTVLIIGGGDGESYAQVAQDLRGEFWEKSEAMLKLAKKNLARSGLSFHLGDFDSGEKPDFILLPFVLDTLRDEEMESLIQRLNNNLIPGGKVVMSDFFPPVNLFQKAVLKLMILFFRLATSHSRVDLPDYDGFFIRAGFRKMEEKTWRKGWIRCQIWMAD